MKNPSFARAQQRAFRERCNAVLRSMQTPEARKGMRAAFDATPSELGRAAVETGGKKH